MTGKIFLFFMSICGFFTIYKLRKMINYKKSELTPQQILSHISKYDTQYYGRSFKTFHVANYTRSEDIHSRFLSTMDLINKSYHENYDMKEKILHFMVYMYKNSLCDNLRIFNIHFTDNISDHLHISYGDNSNSIFIDVVKASKLVDYDESIKDYKIYKFSK